LALGWKHPRNLVYRGLKPENVLLDEAGHVKLTDFGYTKILQGGQDMTSTLCGTVDYLAPELLGNRPHGRGVVWWALGGLTYEMLTCQTPFFSDNTRQMFRMICESEVRFPTDFDLRARDFILRLMEKDPTRWLGVAVRMWRRSSGTVSSKR
jgi:serine/threonine protein kinase